MTPVKKCSNEDKGTEWVKITTAVLKKQTAFDTSFAEVLIFNKELFKSIRRVNLTH